MLRFIILSFALALVAGCTAAGPKGPEVGIEPDGKMDSLRNPNTHLFEGYGVEHSVYIMEGNLFHRWVFRIAEGSADLRLTATDSGYFVDTVMYLYRRDLGDSGWGRYVSRNDDISDEDPGSMIEYAHDAGSSEYAVVVKGYDDDQLGAVDLVVTCDGDACADQVSPDTICNELAAWVEDTCYEEDDWYDCLQRGFEGQDLIAEGCCESFDEPEWGWCHRL